jgi:hypothetical protein
MWSPGRGCQPHPCAKGLCVGGVERHQVLGRSYVTWGRPTATSTGSGRIVESPDTMLIVLMQGQMCMSGTSATLGNRSRSEVVVLDPGKTLGTCMGYWDLFDWCLY